MSILDKITGTESFRKIKCTSDFTEDSLLRKLLEEAMPKQNVDLWLKDPKIFKGGSVLDLINNLDEEKLLSFLLKLTKEIGHQLKFHTLFEPLPSANDIIKEINTIKHNKFPILNQIPQFRGRLTLPHF